jgi:hypothetical protein
MNSEYFWLVTEIEIWGAKLLYLIKPDQDLSWYDTRSPATDFGMRY